MLKKKRKQEKKPKARRVSRPFAALALIAALGFLFVTGVWVHATWLLARAPGQWNQKQLAKIDKNKTDFKFAVFADTHDSSMAFGRIRKEVENGNYLFAIDVGDMAIDAGLIKSRYFINQVSTMKTPVLTAVGNHDIAAGGHATYKKVYGPPYYSFTVGRCMFIVLDDADGKKIDDTQMAWFIEQLKESTKYPSRFVFMHVPPFRGRRDLNLPMQQFLSDRQNAEQIKQLCIDNRIKAFFCGHCHTFDYDIWPNNVHFVMTGGGGGRLWDVEQFRGMYHYIKVTVEGDQGSFELEPINQKSLHFTYQYIEEPWVYIYSYIGTHYWWLGPSLLALCALFTFLALRRRIGSRREPGEETPEP